MEQFTYAPNSKNRDREPGRAGEGATACEEGEETLAQQQKNGQEQDLNQLRKVRRENLRSCSRTEKTRLGSQNMTRHITARRSRRILTRWRENRYPSQAA